MAKVVIIGAGSHTFTKNLVTDIVSFPELRDSTISLMDIDKESLNVPTAFAKKLAEQNGFKTKIESTTDRRKALEGADYVVLTINVGGYASLLANRDIAMKYGVNQAIGDTLGPTGVFKGLSHIPVVLDICHDMEELCPDAWLLNYSNPMAILSWAINDYSHIKNVGLCHSVQGTASLLARYLGVPYEDIPDRPWHLEPKWIGESVDYWVAGINHMAWFLELKWHGKDAYPLLRERLAKNPELYSKPGASGSMGADTVRVEIFKAFGYFVTESSPHMSEYVPYFRKRPELLKKFNIDREIMGTVDRTKGEVNRGRRELEVLKQQISSNYKFPTSRSLEYCSTIINSLETGTPSRINANVKNTGLITNLLEGCCVEVPCLVDKRGIHPCYVGDLPPQLAALNRTNINVQELAVRGIVEKDKTKIFQSILLDPLTSAMLTIDETRQMVDEMFQAEERHS